MPASGSPQASPTDVTGFTPVTAQLLYAVPAYWLETHQTFPADISAASTSSQEWNVQPSTFV